MASAPRRDAAATRKRLLDAARRRFAQDGYAATTTRVIARDAGVNIALISRYFGGKQGLFEACVRPALDALLASTDILSSPANVSALLVSQLTSGDEDASAGAMLLLRSSGDEAMEHLRLQTLGALSEQLATLIPDDIPEEERMLRAQLTLCVGLGIAVMKTSIGLKPLSDAPAEALAGPITALAASLLGGADR